MAFSFLTIWLSDTYSPFEYRRYPITECLLYLNMKIFKRGRSTIYLSNYLLEDGNREGGGLSRSWLSLGNDVMTLDGWDDSSLLDGRRLLETVGVDTAEELFTQWHVVKVLANLLPIGVDKAFGVHACGPVVTGSLAGCVAGTVGRPWGFVATSMRRGRSEKKIIFFRLFIFQERAALKHFVSK